MLHAKVKLSILKEIVDTASILVPEAKFNIDESGLMTKAVDPSRIAMVSIEVQKDAFEEFEAKESTLGIDLEKLKETLKLGSSEDVLILDWDKDANTIVLKVGNLTRKMPLIDAGGMPDPKMPELDLPAKVTLPVEEIKKGVAAAKSISDNISLKISEDGFDLSSKAEGADQANLHLPKDALIDMDINESARSTYPLEQFSKMINAIKSPNVTIRLGTDYPLDIIFEMANGMGKGRYLLAPRVENY